MYIDMSHIKSTLRKEYSPHSRYAWSQIMKRFLQDNISVLRETKHEIYIKGLTQ